MERNSFFMEYAIIEAFNSSYFGGIPIGAVLVKDNKIISRGHNQRVQKSSPILHAEIDCINNAGRLRKNDYRQCILYSTLHPCVMCGHVIDFYSIPSVVSIASDYVFLYSHWFNSIQLRDKRYTDFFSSWVKKNKDLWKEDTGE